MSLLLEFSPRGSSQLVFQGHLYLKMYVFELAGSVRLSYASEKCLPGVTGDLGQTGVPLVMLTDGAGGCPLRKLMGKFPCTGKVVSSIIIIFFQNKKNRVPLCQCL